MDAIGCNDDPLQAAMALVRNNLAKMNSFEETASFLLPHCPVAKKRTSGSKRNIANISDLSASDEKEPDKKQFSGKSPKKGIGKSGVHFRFYGLEEYKKLSKAQKEELKEHRDIMESVGKGRNLGKGPPNPKSSKQISSTIASQIRFFQIKVVIPRAQAQEDQSSVSGRSTSTILAVFYNQKERCATQYQAEATYQCTCLWPRRYHELPAP